MLSRALSLATVTLLVGCLAAVAVHALENLEAGKSPAQIFAGTCNACHKSPRGLLRSVPASSLPGFLRQHYTTSSDMASVLSAYLVSNGAADPRFQARDGKEARQKDGARDGAREGIRESGPREAARAPADQGVRQSPRLPRPGETPDVMRPDLPAQAAIDKGKKDKDKGKKGRHEGPARTEPDAATPQETARRDEGAKPPAEPEPKAEPAKTDSAKTESDKVEPAENAREPGATRPDPVPAVTPAPAATAALPAAPMPGAGSSPPPVQALDMPSAPAGEQPKPLPESPPAVATAPALPPVPPAGPPAVPISQ